MLRATRYVLRAVLLPLLYGARRYVRCSVEQIGAAPLKQRMRLRVVGGLTPPHSLRVAPIDSTGTCVSPGKAYCLK